MGKKNIENFIKHGDVEDAHVEYIEDCFADMERPRFGWRAKITLMENEPCEIDAENPERSTCRINSISNNEDETKYYYAQSRQTGESFRSAAPPECRVEYVCNTPPSQPPIPTQPDPDQIAPAQPAAAQPVPAQPLTNQAVPQELPPNLFAAVDPIQGQPEDAQDIEIIPDQSPLDQAQITNNQLTPAPIQLDSSP